MEKIIASIKDIPQEVKDIIESRLKEFSSFKDKSGGDWFSELCFCILTANSRASSAIAIQNELKFKGFSSFSQEQLRDCIIKNRHRFHNNKSRYIVEARKHINVKSILQNKSEIEAREWLVENIHGLGYKEASHFLRNTGSENIAILDRHILNLMHDYQLIVRPKTLTKKSYLEIESKFHELAARAGMSSAKLDLSMWYLKTGVVLK